MHHVSAQGIDECMINVHYYYYTVLMTQTVWTTHADTVLMTQTIWTTQINNLDNTHSLCSEATDVVMTGILLSLNRTLGIKQHFCCVKSPMSELPFQQ